MKKILLVGPYKNTELRIGQYLAPHVGIYRIKSYLEKNAECVVDIIDLDLKGKKYFINALKNNNYDIIGFSILQFTLKNDLVLIHEAKELSPESLLIAGGQGAVFNYEMLLKETPINIIVRGFGELALLKILSNSSKLEMIEGLYIQDENQQIINTGVIKPYTYEQFRDISLSFQYDKVPYEQYWTFMKKIYTKKHLEIMKNEDFLYTIRIMTSSHCPHKCSFCSSTNFLDEVCGNQRRLALNAEDIYFLVRNALKAHPKCKAIYFNDDDFLFDNKRIRKLCSLLKGIDGVSYFCLSRLDNVNEELLKTLEKANFKFIIYGVESFSKKVLNDMHKGILANDPKEFSKEVIRKTIDAGIIPLMNIILFYTTSRIQDIIETIEASIDLVNYGARLAVYTYVEVYPGSAMLKKGSFDFVHENINVKEKHFVLPSILLPHLDEVKDLAAKSIKLRDKLMEDILNKYDWEGVVPHPLYGLVLFLAVYKIIGRSTSRIENSINHLMINEPTIPTANGKIKVKGEC